MNAAYQAPEGVLPPGWVAIPLDPTEEQWTLAQGTLLDMGWPAATCLAARVQALIAMTRQQWQDDVKHAGLGEFRRSGADLQVLQEHLQVPWKAGSEFLPYHPSASHVPPDYRDGWNQCYAVARSCGAWQPQFDAISNKQEALVLEFCAEIAGPKGHPGRPPDPVRLLEMAQALYEAEREAMAP